MNKSKLVALFGIASAICIALSGLRAAPATDSGEAGHIGSSGTVKAILKFTDCIGVGRFLSVGVPLEPEGIEVIGEKPFGGAKIVIDQFLMGNAENEMVADYHLLTHKWNESQPKEGSGYIFFLRKTRPTSFTLLKILPATEENIIKIKAIVSGANARP